MQVQVLLARLIFEGLNWLVGVRCCRVRDEKYAKAYPIRHGLKFIPRLFLLYILIILQKIRGELQKAIIWRIRVRK